MSSHCDDDECNRHYIHWWNGNCRRSPLDQALQSVGEVRVNIYTVGNIGYAPVVLNVIWFCRQNICPSVKSFNFPTNKYRLWSDINRNGSWPATAALSRLSGLVVIWILLCCCFFFLFSHFPKAFVRARQGNRARPNGNQFQTSPAASPEILTSHSMETLAFHTVAYSDDRLLYYQFSLPYSYISR